MRHGMTPVLIRVLALLLASLAVFPAVSTAGPPPLPDSRLGVRTAPLLLLSRPDVREDLRLTEAQAASAEQAITDLYLRAAELKGKPDAEVIAARRAIDEAQQTWIDTNLSVNQRARLVQIDLQWEGPTALLSRPIVAESIALTPDQRHTLAQAIAERNAQRAQGKTRPEDERALAATALSILNDEQKIRWKAMLGHPFQVQTLASQPASNPRR